MNIPENVISRKLKNVYFIIGGSCAGKTTASKYLGEKYKMYRYSTDDMRKTYYEIADIEYQPALYQDKIRGFSQIGIDEAIAREAAVICELTPIIIADLIELSGKYEKIICEGVYAVGITPLVDYNRIIYLSTSDEIIKRDFYSRPAQSHIMESTMKRTDMTDSEKEDWLNYRRNLACIYTKLDEFFKYDIKRYYRNENSIVEDMLNTIEQHFGLT
ncbi:MAG: ATP-binding protein [Oscillospiraceae bacterium]|nr:ATP-binding protein [Oscillospiraceae bacterium]